MTQSDISTASDSSSNSKYRNADLEKNRSEDSSFYGDQDIKATYVQQLSEFSDEDYWRVHDWNIQVIVARKRKWQDTSSYSDEPARKKHKSLAGRTTASTGNKESKVHEPFNPYEGYSTALQIEESLDLFLRRLRPSNTTTGDPWMWCANFDTEYRDADRQLARFKDTGTKLLEEFVAKRSKLEASFDPPKHPGAITRMLQTDRQHLQDNILKAAKDCYITTGKWMLFAPPSRIDRCWTAVVYATVDGRLGISAKVSTKPGGGSESTHVICVYAKDFEDQADIKRILKELIRLKLAAAVPGPILRGDGNVQRQIYFKADAYTWLNIMGDNEYKLKASMYSTSSLLTKDDVAELR